MTTKTALPDLPKVWIGADSANLPNGECQLDWSVMLTVAAFVMRGAADAADGKDGELDRVNELAAKHGLKTVSSEEFFVVAVAQRTMDFFNAAADVALAERKDKILCSKLASHGMAAMNYISKISKDHEVLISTICSNVHAEFAKCESVEAMWDWLFDYFSVNKSPRKAKGFA